MADSPQRPSDSSLRVEELAELVRQQTEAIQGLKAQLSKQISREIANTTHQLEQERLFHVSMAVDFRGNRLGDTRVRVDVALYMLLLYSTVPYVFGLLHVYYHIYLHPYFK